MSIDMYNEKVADAAQLIRDLTGGKEWFHEFDRNTQHTLELFIAAMDKVKDDILASLPAPVAPMPAGTDKLREAILALDIAEPYGYAPSETFAFERGVIDALAAAASLAASTAVQAPVREVPETWISVDDRLPEVRDDSVLALFNHGGIDMVHLQEYFGDITNGYSDDGEQLYTQYYKSAGITHWCALPAAPVLTEPKP